MSHVQQVAQTIIHATLRLAADVHPAARSPAPRYRAETVAYRRGLESPRLIGLEADFAE